MTFKGTSLLTLSEWNSQALQEILKLAHQVKWEKKTGYFPKRLKNKNIALIFEKHSTRTRCAFLVAAIDEGAHAECMGPQEIHLGAKESVADTARVLGRFFDGIQFRGFLHQTVEDLAKHSGVPIWNGLTDDHHPTQILADLMTLQEEFGSLAGLKLVYMGDARNNVAHSLMMGAALSGIHLVLACPSSLAPLQTWMDTCAQVAKSTGATLKVTQDLGAALQGAHAVYTDVWVSMGEEGHPDIAQRVKLLKEFQVNAKSMGATGRNESIFLHCLPANKGQEVTEEVFESSQSRVFDQAENRMHTIKALMLATMAGVCAGDDCS
jgi:ornithine carbamoyltransferase